MKPIVISHFNEKKFQSACLSFANGVDRCSEFYTYELGEYLSNTRVTFTDNITYNATGTAPNITFSTSARIQVNSYLNYYAYGMPKSPNGDYQGGAAAFFCKEITPFRFGFNTQERSDEIAGFLNHNTAQFWEYDTRIAFRWNIDPVEENGISGYNCFNANPIVFNDVRGDKPAKLENGNVAYRGKSAASNWLRASIRTLFTGKTVTNENQGECNYRVEDYDYETEQSDKPKKGKCETCKLIGLQHGDYFSDIHQQIFQADFSLNFRSFPGGMTTQEQWNHFKTAFSIDPGKIINNDLAAYNLIDRDGSNGVSVGDHFDISIFPDNGSVVVTSVKITKNSMSVTVQTLQGHPDAGTNTFSASFNPATGDVHFQTENWSRTNDNFGGLIAAAFGARDLQQEQWRNVLGQVGLSLGRPIVTASSYVQAYGYNELTNKLGKKKGQPIRNDISRQVEHYIPAGQLGKTPYTQR